MSITSLTGSPSATSTSASKTQLSDNFDTFLKLLSAQLANQDPLDPLDSNKFTEQLVAYSQVEQQISTNEKLEGLISQSQAGAVTYLGKLAVVASDAATSTGAGAQWSYKLDGAAQTVRLVVKDSAGREIFTQAGQTTAGEQTFAWDGKDRNGKAAPSGTYRLSVQAVDSNGGGVRASIATEERITGVSFGTDGVMLRTASGEKPFSSVKSLRD